MEDANDEPKIAEICSSRYLVGKLIFRQRPAGFGVEHPQAEGQADTAVARYGIVMSYLVYENTIFWARAGFFSVANSALLGLMIQRLPSWHAARFDEIVIPLAGSAFGLLFSVLWYRVLKAGEVWIDHWHGLLVDLEGAAFGTAVLLRPSRKKELDHQAPLKKIARQVVQLFACMWLAVIAYSVVAVI
jgi:hypothetical protein